MLRGAIMALVHNDKNLGQRRAAAAMAWTPRHLFARLIDWLREWRRDAADQRHLASLNDHDLRDLGLSKSDVGGGPMPRDRFW